MAVGVFTAFVGATRRVAPTEQIEIIGYSDSSKSNASELMQ